MRKRLVIGAMAAMVIGVAAYVVWQPERGTVEWHKREYLKAVSGPSCVGQWVWDYGPEALAERLDRLRDQRIARHRDALVEFGFLAKTILILSNAPVQEIAYRVLMRRCVFYPPPPGLQLAPDNVDYRFFSYEKGTNFIQIICVGDDAGAWQRAIGKADVDDATWNKMAFTATSADKK